MKEKKPEGMLKPIIVLTVICIVIAGVLGVTNAVTAPIIEKAKADAMLATLRQLLPDATGFTELDCGIDRVEHVYKDDGGSGYIVLALGKGYAGDVEVTVALDAKGAVAGVSIDTGSETKTVGGKIADESYVSKYYGLTSNAESVDVLSGATYSSHAMQDAINLAFKAYAAVKEG